MMILRIFRAIVLPGRQAEFEKKVRDVSIPLVKRQEGMLAFFSGKSATDNADEFVMVTLWKSLADLQAFAGGDWRQPVVPEEEAPLVQASFVSHYDLLDGTSL